VVVAASTPPRASPRFFNANYSCDLLSTCIRCPQFSCHASYNIIIYIYIYILYYGPPRDTHWLGLRVLRVYSVIRSGTRMVSRGTWLVLMGQIIILWP
jgi:hypothetical protein